MDYRICELEELQNEYIYAFDTWLDFLNKLLVEKGEQCITGEEGQARRINTLHRNKDVVLHPSFDKIRGREDAYHHNPEFHVKDGDGLFKDGSWVSAKDFTDDAWLQLTDYIEFTQN